MKDFKLSEIRDICKIHHGNHRQHCLTALCDCKRHDCPIYEVCSHIADNIAYNWKIDKENNNENTL